MNIHYPRGRLLLLLWQPNNRGTNYHNNTSSFEDWGQRDTPWLVERLKRKEMRPYCRKWWAAWYFGVLSLVLWPLAVLMLSAFIDCFCLACTYVRSYMHDSLSFSPVYCQWFELWQALSGCRPQAQVSGGFLFRLPAHSGSLPLPLSLRTEDHQSKDISNDGSGFLSLTEGAVDMWRRHWSETLILYITCTVFVILLRNV